MIDTVLHAAGLILVLAAIVYVTAAPFLLDRNRATLEEIRRNESLPPTRRRAVLARGIPETAGMVDEFTRYAVAREKRQADWDHKVTAAEEVRTFLRSSRTVQWRKLRDARAREAQAERDARLDQTVTELVVKNDPDRLAARIVELEASLKPTSPPSGP